MQHLSLEQRRALGPRAPWHAGDIAWGLRQHAGREREWRIRLWEEDGAVVAWSWLTGATGKLEFDVRPDRRVFLDEILAEPDAETAFAFSDDDELRAALARHGFRRPGEEMHFYVRDVPEAPAPPALPSTASAAARSIRPTFPSGSRSIATSGRRRG
jgi:hypothetical protein